MARMTTAGVFLAALMTAAAAGAQTRSGGADICVSIDEAHDTFSPPDRAAALLLVARQFEFEGQRVVSQGCSISYTVSHVRLGRTIVVTLTGPNEHREGNALGLDDLPALYSQMVRSIVTGRPMSGFNVVDRTNVTVSQTAPQRVQADSFGYVRLGYGSIFGDHAYGGPALGFGYRVELDSFGVDVSFFNLQVPTSPGYYESSSGGTAGSLLKIEGLYFTNRVANASAYLGGGISWSHADFGSGAVSSSTTVYQSSWTGSGLQGELTVGYEMPRSSTLRLFVQADAALPFYSTTSATFSRSGVTTTAGHRYAPSLAVSVGVGWQRDRGAHR